MGIKDRLTEWFTEPVVEVSARRCQDCGMAVDADRETCPDCGGEVRETGEETVPLYWGHMD